MLTSAGDDAVVKHDAHPRPIVQQTQHKSEMEQELEGMTQRHAGDDSFIRGVAGLDYSYAEEDADAD
jgi:hypothetical protein